MRAATVKADDHLASCVIARDRLLALLSDSLAVRRWMMDEVRRSYPATP